MTNQKRLRKNKNRKKDQKRRQGMEGAGECGWEGEGTRSCIFFCYKCSLVFQ